VSSALLRVKLSLNLLFSVSALAIWLSGCAQYTGTGRALTPNVWERERGWISVAHVPLLRQTSEHDCGPSALAMVLAYWTQMAATSAPQPETGMALHDDRRYSAGELRDRARSLGFAAYVVEGQLEDILHELQQARPVIVGMAKPTLKGAVAHYEVVVGLHPATRRIATLDPALGWRVNSLAGFLQEWLPAGQLLLVVLGPTSLIESKR
jgi:ABC-type bacteriocin/lantibiotic exporter with double-glycine peptidase domain